MKTLVQSRVPSFGGDQFLRKQVILPTLTLGDFLFFLATFQKKLSALHLCLADGAPALSEVQFIGIFHAIL